MNILNKIENWMENNKIGSWWNDKSIDIYNIDGKNIALWGWNGDKWYKCFEVSEDLLEVKHPEIEYVVEPVYSGNYIIGLNLYEIIQ